ncbi:MAG: nucleotidyltransferase domain-containing protein [Candidatus Anstonellales archaeon]
MKNIFQKWNRILPYLLEHPYKEIHLRELARKTGTSCSTCYRAVKELVGYGLAERNKSYGRVFVKLVLSPAVKKLKIAYSTHIIEKSGMVEHISQNSFGLQSLVVYGSIARGEDDENSDCDILVIASKCNANSMTLSKMLKREVSLKCFTLEGWKKVAEKNRAFYLEVITNSIVLKGNLPIVEYV